MFSEPISGGMIARTSRAQLTDGRTVVVKRCPYPAELEAEGLLALAGAGVAVPRVLGTAGGTLVLEHVGGPADWPALGLMVAAMHRVTADRFGWHRDNRAGRFTQPNTWCEDWSTFFAEHRVRAHLADPQVPADLRRRLEIACDGPLPALLPDRPPASLTHGDLWVGNIVEGRWIVDPEVSYADRELDLAYMHMSRSMPDAFFDSYFGAWPADPTYPERRPALQLHHRLLQLRHFGARHLPGVESILDHYGW